MNESVNYSDVEFLLAAEYNKMNAAEALKNKIYILCFRRYKRHPDQ